MRKLIAAVCLVATSTSYAHNNHHNHHNHHDRLHMGILGGIVLGSALANRHYHYQTPGVIGTLPPVTYVNPPVIHAPSVYVTPSHSHNPMLDSCIITVYNPYMNRNEEVNVVCRKTYQ
jgi:hypothetical protein